MQTESLATFPWCKSELKTIKNWEIENKDSKAEAYSEPFQISMMECFAKTVNGFNH